MSISRTILVTGASRGIGFLTCKRLAACGHHVIAGMRAFDTDNAQQAIALRNWAQAHNTTIDVIELDVSDDVSVNKAADTIEKRDCIDVLVNNAGVMPVGITEGYTLEQVKSFFDVNYFGAVRLCRAVLPGMRRRKNGLMIHVSTNAARVAIPFFAHYCASKWALEAFVESIHYELADSGIESVLVEPGPHNTQLVDNIEQPADQKRVDQYTLLKDKPAELINKFTMLFKKQNPIHDPDNVAVTIAGLVNMTGKRPIRTLVGDDMGVSQLNEQCAPIQSAMLKTLF